MGVGTSTCHNPVSKSLILGTEIFQLESNMYTSAVSALRSKHARTSKMKIKWVEMLLLLLIAVILTVTAYPVLTGKQSPVSWHWSLRKSVTEQCISGYKFVVSKRGDIAQVLDNSGHGVVCNVNSF